MSRLFYPRLAATSIRKNAKTYLPYMLTCIITVAMFYMNHLALNEQGNLRAERLREHLFGAVARLLGNRIVCADLFILHEQLSDQTQKEGVRPV